MEFDWLDAPFDLHETTPKEIEESFEDPFSLRLLPEGGVQDEKARYFNLGKASATAAFSPSSGRTENDTAPSSPAR